MSAHLKLLSIIINMVIGGLVTVLVYHFYAISKQKFLVPVIYHSIFFNVLIFLLYVAKYSEINIPYGFAGRAHGTVLGLGYLLAYLLIMALTYTLFLTIWRLREKPVSKRFYTILAVFLVVFLAWYGTRFLLASMGTKSTIFEFIFQNLAILFFAAEFILYGYVFLSKAAFADRAKRKVARGFSLLYLSRYVFAAIAWLSFPELIRAFCVFLYCSLVPYLWLKLYLSSHQERVPLLVQGDSLPDDIFRKHQISSREREIIGFILEGKSNREIGRILFISERTVKNHIYNIYRKMNIKSRYQLINLVNLK
jgi:DNA-binding CsgD family transcriptional regulator